MKAGDVMCYRCFGLLISPGRNVKHSDMQLIELVSSGIELVSGGIELVSHGIELVSRGIEQVRCGIFWRLGEPLPVFLSGLFVGLSQCQSLCLFYVDKNLSLLKL